MWIEANNAIKQLNKSIDGTLTNKEKQTFIDAYRKDKRGVLEASQNKLRRFLISDYSQRSYALVWKKWVQAFQRFAKISQDGDYGPNTFRAIVEYQEANGLKVDGIIWKQTLGAIAGQRPSSQWKKRTAVEKKEEQKTGSLFSKLFGSRKTKIKESVDKWTERYNVNTTKARAAIKRLSLSQRRNLMKQLWSKNTYSSLIKAIAKFQKVSWLDPDGVLGPATKRALREAKKLPYSTPMKKKEIGEKNNAIKLSRRRWGIEKLRGDWAKIYAEFFIQLNRREQNEVNNGKPLVLVDARSKKLLFITKNRTDELDIILWQNGITKGKYKKLDKKTPIWKVHKFAWVKFSENVSRKILRKWEPYHPDLMPADYSKWSNLRYNSKVKSYYWTKNGVPNKRVTVVWVSIDSDTAQEYGGRYFHVVWPNRYTTFGCVGIKWKNRAAAKLMAVIIQEKWWFGYVSKV